MEVRMFRVCQVQSVSLAHPGRLGGLEMDVRTMTSVHLCLSACLISGLCPFLLCLSYTPFVGLPRWVNRGTLVIHISGLPGDPAKASAVSVHAA